MSDKQTKPTTTDAGIPVASDEHSLTVGRDGPIMLHDHYLIEQMANFNRERIPERQPHAKGGGAFGYFEVTEDVSQYTQAAVFQPGTKTDTLIRFSTVAGERGSPDTWRDPRGFSLKFYTSEGNYDMVGNNTPVFFLRDPIKFQQFIRSQKRFSWTSMEVSSHWRASRKLQIGNAQQIHMSSYPNPAHIQATQQHTHTTNYRNHENARRKCGAEIDNCAIVMLNSGPHESYAHSHSHHDKPPN